jgi:hypothetical protein
MLKSLLVSVVALISLTFSAPARAQTADANAAAQDKWNNVPPLRSTYAGKKSGPAPVRDISGIWDAAYEDGGRQTSGVKEHPAVYPGGKGTEGGHPDETGITHPLPYTPAGRAALKANRPSGPSVRQVPSATSNDPINRCDPLGFPYMELFELRSLDVVQAKNQVLLISPFYGNYRIIWTDGRELPKNEEPRWNGYSVGRWLNDYDFFIETTGMMPKSWIDHAGRPHSDALRVEETWHRVDHDNMQLTLKIIDPKMYTEPWLALDKFPLHLQPPDFDIQELRCAPSEMERYNDNVGHVVLDPKAK